MFTRIQSLTGLERLAFDLSTATALQIAIAQLSECADVDAARLIQEAQRLLTEHAHPFEVADCQFIRDCVMVEKGGVL